MIVSCIISVFFLQFLIIILLPPDLQLEVSLRSSFDSVCVCVCVCFALIPVCRCESLHERQSDQAHCHGSGSRRPHDRMAELGQTICRADGQRGAYQPAERKGAEDGERCLQRPQRRREGGSLCCRWGCRCKKTRSCRGQLHALKASLTFLNAAEVRRKVETCIYLLRVSQKGQACKDLSPWYLFLEY